MGLNDYLKSLKSDDWLTPLYKAGADVQGPGWGNPRTYASPSASSASCPRDVELSVLGYSTGFAEKNRDRMDNGTAAHERIQRRFDRAGILYKAELGLAFFRDGYIFEGSFESRDAREAMQDEHGHLIWQGVVDVMASRPGSNKLYVGEIKSMGQWRFKKLPEQLDDWERMATVMLRSEASYTKQAMQYIVKAREAGYDVADEAFMFFEDTNTQDYRVVWIKPSQAHLDLAFQNAEIALEAVREGFLVEPPFERMSRECRSCYKASICNLLRDNDPTEVANVERQLQRAAEAFAR